MNTRLAVNGDLPAWAVVLALVLVAVSLGVLVVYELRFRSARVDTWLDHHVVVFPEVEPGPTTAERPAQPGASQPEPSWPEPD